MTHNQLDMINQLISVNHEIERKELEIANLKSKNDILVNELKTEKEFVESLKKLKEAMIFINEHMNA